MGFVVDSSVALNWCFEDERTPATAALLDRVGALGAVAPQHWPLEALNSLMMAERRNRLTRFPIDLDQGRKVHEGLLRRPRQSASLATAEIVGH